MQMCVHTRLQALTLQNKFGISATLAISSPTKAAARYTSSLNKIRMLSNLPRFAQRFAIRGIS